MASVSFHASDLEAAEAWLWLAIERPVDRFPRELVSTQFRDRLIRRRAAAVRHDATITHQPALAVARPHAFGEAALGVKRPRADALLRRVPADDLPALERRLFAVLYGEIAGEKTPAARPL